MVKQLADCSPYSHGMAYFRGVSHVYQVSSRQGQKGTLYFAYAANPFFRDDFCNAEGALRDLEFEFQFVKV
jgi:hypothetical protein